MKFSYPYSYENRTVLIQDKVLFIPSYYDRYGDFKFPGWQSPAVFGNDRQVVIEYCSGNGEWIVEKAKERPEVNFVAVERRYDRVSKLFKRAKAHQITNLFIVFGEACLASKLYFPSQSVAEIYINFPDPWPKTKHAKHRLITDPFLCELKRIAQPNATLTLATDDPDTSLRGIECFSKQFQPHFQAPYYVTELAGYGASFFQTLWQQKGCTIRYVVFDHR